MPQNIPVEEARRILGLSETITDVLEDEPKMEAKTSA